MRIPYSHAAFPALAQGGRRGFFAAARGALARPCLHDGAVLKMRRNARGAHAFAAAD